MAKRCALSTGNLLRGGLPRNSVDRITDHPDMTSALYRGRKASTQTNKQKLLAILLNEQFIHHTQINLRPNKQLLGTQKQAYPSFLSYFLILFRLRHSDTLGEF